MDGGDKYGFRMTQVHYIYYVISDQTGGRAHMVMRVVVNIDEALLAHLLCGLVPNRSWTSMGPQPGGWGPLI